MLAFVLMVAFANESSFVDTGPYYGAGGQWAHYGKVSTSTVTCWPQYCLPQ